MGYATTGFVSAQNRNVLVACVASTSKKTPPIVALATSPAPLNNPVSLGNASRSVLTNTLSATKPAYCFPKIPFIAALAVLPALKVNYVQKASACVHWVSPIVMAYVPTHSRMANTAERVGKPALRDKFVQKAVVWGVAPNPPPRFALAVASTKAQMPFTAGNAASDALRDFCVNKGVVVALKGRPSAKAAASISASRPCIVGLVANDAKKENAVVSANAS